jgi:hypothetical protein
MALPLSWIKNTSPTTSGATVSAGPAAKPMQSLAASRLSYDLADAAQIENAVRSTSVKRVTDRRPYVLASGTHQILLTPRRSTLTEIRRVSVGNGNGPSVRINAGTINGRALEMPAA